MAIRAEKRELVENALLLPPPPLSISKFNSLEAKSFAKDRKGYRLRWFNTSNGQIFRLAVKPRTCIEGDGRSCCALNGGNKKSAICGKQK